MGEPMMNYDAAKSLAAGERDSSIPIFGKHPVLDDEKSKAVGHPVYVEQDYVRIITPGVKDQPHRRVREEDKQRWPRQWSQYQAGQEQTVEGLPVDRWPLLDVAQAKTLQAQGVKTVEQLANMPDANLHKLGPGAVGLKQKAKSYLTLAADANVVDRLNERLDAMEAENAKLRSLLEGKEMKKPSPSMPHKRRGRPPKKPKVDNDATHDLPGSR